VSEARIPAPIREGEEKPSYLRWRKGEGGEDRPTGCNPSCAGKEKKRKDLSTQKGERKKKKK